MEKETILLVEDETGIRELIQLYLENRGYSVLTAENGEQALNIADSGSPRLILLDIEMPGIDGFEVCKKLREKTNVPILFVSSRRDVVDRITSLELGGDDYITKPFDFEELEARVQANLRRYQMGQKIEIDSSNIIQHGELKIDLDRYQCFLKEKLITLSAKELQLLILLVKRPNQVWSAEQIYDHVWGFDSVGDIQTVKVHISNLRRKVEKDPANPSYIKTVRGFGYIFSVN